MKIGLIIALILNVIASVFVWFFIGDFLFRISPFHALAILGLFFVQIVTRQLIYMGVNQ